MHAACVESLTVRHLIGGDEHVLVDGVSLSVDKGATLGIIGESGSGKTLTVRSLIGLLDPTLSVSADELRLGETDLLTMSGRDWRELRGSTVSMIFQDAVGSLDPLFTVGQQLREAVRTHQDLRRSEVHRTAVELLTAVGIAGPEARMKAYPHQLSGGMAQRVAIAIAIANRPDVLIADEATTALDVTIQRQILVLLKRLQADFGCAIVFVSHDLATVASIADEVAVMYAGRIVERGPADSVLRQPQHPYTRGLLRSQPHLGARQDGHSGGIPGLVPAPGARPPGCAFEPRCDLGRGRSICQTERPVLAVDGADHESACHFRQEIS